MPGDAADFSGDGHQVPWVEKARAEFPFQEKRGVQYSWAAGPAW